MEMVRDREKRFAVRPAERQRPVRPRQINDQPDNASGVLDPDQPVREISRPALAFRRLQPEPVAIREIAVAPGLFSVDSLNESIGRVELVFGLLRAPCCLRQVSIPIVRMTRSL